MSGDGKSRYFDSVLLLPAGQGDLCEFSDSDNEQEQADTVREMSLKEASVVGAIGDAAGQSIQLAILGSYKSLTAIHPACEDALQLWNIYLQNVESLCKILHTPTMSQVVKKISSNPLKASKGEECLLFAIYYFAVYSMPDTECLRLFQQSRRDLMAKYQRAVLQALVNASWLKTTSLSVLQAYTLFLLAVRSQVDPDTFWSLTGIAMRLAQRMGVHRDGEDLGLPPFEVQMRRRLFWQLLPLDSFAGQVSGTGILISPDSWDTKRPLNINDAQIHPGMKDLPVDQRGATEMLFCLAKAELSNFYNKTGVKLKGASASSKNAQEVEELIDGVENRIETSYLRYCDILNPLHFLTLAIVRSAANVVRLRNRMAPLMDKSISDHDRSELCTLARKILDTDNAIYGNTQLRGFHWSVKSFFLWDAFLCILFSLCKDSFFSDIEVQESWKMVEEVYSNHGEVSERRRALYVVICDVTLKAWLANPPQLSGREPPFIAALRKDPKQGKGRLREKNDDSSSSSEVGPESVSVSEVYFGSGDGPGQTTDLDFVSSSSDWMFWDQLCRDIGIG
ncbi:Transcription factor [Moelleriella libera RCEF 2490]|uniref:Transcription factor n=1 Tax=Moelleriella libera RCEF 2490 TaxID=1081109 RepID=A0A168AFL2_9HYPO|nr:Transcription factor [Moelleriella libera RCEF 2490]